MAEAGFEELAKELQCPVCFDEMDKPKVLNCRHVYCSICLRRLLQFEKLTCPLCKVVQENISSIDQLPEPLLISQLQEKITRFITVSKDIGASSKTCDNCDKMATDFCKACMEYLCKTCRQEHAVDKALKSHHVTHISKWTACIKHNGRLLIGYCRDCRQGLCTRCTKKEHINHNIIDIHESTFVEERKQALEECNIYSAAQMDMNSNPYICDMTELKKDIHRKSMDTVLKLNLIQDNINAALETLKNEIKQNAAADKKRLDLHIGEVEDLAATRNSLHTFIEEILHRDSATEIVMAVDELPDLPGNSTHVPPSCKVPILGDTANIMRDIHNICRYEHPVFTAAPSTPPTSTTNGPQIRHVSSSSADHDIQRASTNSAKSSIQTTDRLSPDSSRHISTAVKYVHKWETWPGGNTSDVLWDEEGQVWWLRTEGGLYKYTTDGTLMAEIGGNVIKGYGHLCINSREDLVVTTDESIEKIMCFTKCGEMVKSFSVAGSVRFSGITYCPHRNVYVVADAGSTESGDKNRLLFINSFGKVVQEVSSPSGGTTDLFKSPHYVTRADVSSDMCYIIFSEDDCLQILTHDGKFEMELGGSLGLRTPRGACVDQGGRIIVCDRDNRQVVTFSDCFSDYEQIDISAVLLSPETLNNQQPNILGVTKNMRTVVIGFWGSDVFSAYKISDEISSWV